MGGIKNEAISIHRFVARHLPGETEWAEWAGIPVDGPALRWRGQTGRALFVRVHGL